MDNRLYELGCKTGLLNYIDHETPRFYFINANADLDDFDAFCAEITEEYAAEIERLREALRELLFCPGILRAHDHRDCEKTLTAQRKALSVLGEKE